MWGNEKVWDDEWRPSGLEGRRETLLFTHSLGFLISLFQLLASERKRKRFEVEPQGSVERSHTFWTSEQFLVPSNGSKSSFLHFVTGGSLAGSTGCCIFNPLSLTSLTSFSPQSSLSFSLSSLSSESSLKDLLLCKRTEEFLLESETFLLSLHRPSSGTHHSQSV